MNEEEKQLTTQEFLDLYEQNAQKMSETAGVVTDVGQLNLAPTDDASTSLRAGEMIYDPNQELAPAQSKFEIDTSAILSSIDYGANKPSVDEEYCAFSLLSGRIKPEDLDKSVLPYMVAAVSHTLFGTKNDFDGTIIGNTLKTYDRTKGDYIEGFDRESGKWDSLTLLKRIKDSWDIINDSTGKKRQMVYEDEWRLAGLNKGDRDFFSQERSIEQLDYMFDIASKNIGSFDKFKLYDDQVARQSASQVGIPMDLKNWFGIKSVFNELAMESDRLFTGAYQFAKGDTAASAKTMNNWHYALDTKGFYGGAYHQSDQYILDMAADMIGVKRGDYSAIQDRVMQSKDRMVQVSDKNGNVQAVIRVADDPVSENDMPTKTSLMIDSANEVYYKMNVINKFIDDFGDAVGKIRLADAIGIIGGKHTDAAEGVAIYMSDEDGNADGLRDWANRYLDAATNDEDSARRFDTVQRAFYVCASAKRPKGVIPYGGTDGFYGLVKETGAGLANLALDFGYDIGGFLSGLGHQWYYWVERGVEKMHGETEEQAIMYRRQHMIDQQVRNIASTEIFDQGTVTGWLGKQVLGFKAFEWIFSARLSPLLKRIPGNPKWAKSTADWLTKPARGAKLGKVRARAKGLLAEADEIEFNANRLMAQNTWRIGPDNLRLAENSLDAIERAEALRASANKALSKMESLVGKERAMEIMDFCRPIIDRSPGLFTLYASSADDMERQSADKYAQLMKERGTGYDDEMWSEASNIIKGRAAVSTSFMLGLGNFLKRIKAGAGSAAENEVGDRIRRLEERFMADCKKGDMNAVQAWFLGFRIAFGEGVLREAGNMYRMGFGMGATGQLGENIQYAAAGLLPWENVGDNVVEAGAAEGASMGVTIAFMRSFTHGFPSGRDIANRNLAYFKTMAQTQRPENIISSILANNRRLRQEDNSVEEMTHDTAKAAFSERMADYFQRAVIADDAERDKALAEWRKENRKICGEEGAKTFDAFVHDIKYSPQMFDWQIKRMGQRMTAEDLSKTLKVGGIENTVKKLDDGSFAFDLSFDFGGKKIVSKLLFKAGRIYVRDGEQYKSSYAIDVVKNILDGDAPKELIDKYNGLSDEQKLELETGKDIDGILALAEKKMLANGLFFTKEQAIAGKQSGEENLVDIENPEVYDGIVFLATGKAEIGTTRHEVMGHAVLDALKRSGALTDADMDALKEHFGGDNKWEERFSDAVVEASSAGDASAAKDLLPQQRTLVTKVRDAARGVLEALHIVKNARGPEATFNVEAFMKDTLERANETVKLRAERDRMEELVRANAEKAMAEAKAEADAKRREMEQSILEEQERNKTLGQERAVRIAKSRDEMARVATEIERLSNTAKTLDDYLAAVEKAKGDFIKHLKRFGFDKGEVGKLVEDWYLKTIDAYGDAMIERVEAERVAAEAKAKADALEAENKQWREKARKQWEETNKKLEEDAAAKAKAEYAARLNAEKQRLEAKAESKKRGEELAKQLAIVVQNAEQIGYSVHQNLLDITSVSKFDSANKTLLRAFDRAVAKIPNEIVKVHRDVLKREMYEARKKMELKADAEKARIAEEKKQRDEQLAKEKEARAKQREAEAKARQKRAEEAKRKAEAKKKTDAVAKKVAERAERLTKSEIAAKKKARRDAELIVKGYELMQNGQPIPNACVIAGLKGDELTRKRAAMRKAGYYYDSASNCWVNKKSAPKKFRKAAAKTVANAVNNVVNAKVLAKTKGTGEKSEEFYMGVLNSILGGDGEVAEGSDTSRKQPKVKKEERKKQEENSQELEMFKQLSALVRQQADAEGWTKEALEERLRMLASLELERDAKTGEVRIKGGKKGKEEPKKEEKPVKNDETPDNKTLREEKKWWTKQLTPEERLGLAVVEVLGKPWGVVYCPGEVIQGGEQLRLQGGQSLPEGAVVRPFSVAAAEKAIDAMADRKRNEGVLEAEMRTKPFFNAQWAIAQRKQRDITRAENAKQRAEAEKMAAEKAEHDEIENLRAEISSLNTEAANIDAHTVERKRTIEEISNLNMAQLLNLPVEYTKEEADARKSEISKRVNEINEEIKRRTSSTDGDGRFSIGGIYTGSIFDYAKTSRLGGIDDGPSLKNIGTGEGSQVYGWGLYGSNRRGVAERYAKLNKRFTFDDKVWDGNVGDWGLNSIMYSYLWSKEEGSDFAANLKKQDETYRKTIDEIKKEGEKHPEYTLLEKYLDAASKTGEAVKDPAKTLERIKELSPSEYIYEQTFFTDRAQGDESHLLNWYEPVSDENLARIAKQKKTEGLQEPVDLELWQGARNPSGEAIYNHVVRMTGSPMAASEFLARAGIDGVKYPVNSYRKAVKDGDKAGWNYVSFRDDNIRVDKKWMDGALQYSSEGKMMIAFREGTERLFMREYDVLHDRAKELVDEMMDGFLLGPAANAAEEIIKSGDIDARSMIPNWLVNERVELANSPEGFSVTLPSGLQLFIRRGGFGGDNIRKVRSAKEAGDTEGLHAEVQVEFADGKAKMPYGFIKAIEEDERRVTEARKAASDRSKKAVAALQKKGVGAATMKKIRDVGLLDTGADAEYTVNYTVADFFPDSKTLASIYPDTYNNTSIIIRGSERAKSLVDAKGKPVPEPLFADGQSASLDEAGNIIIDVSRAGKRTRAGKDNFEDALLRDITACVVKKVRREEHLDDEEHLEDDAARSAEYFLKIVNGVTGRDKGTGASTKFRLRDDKTLSDIAHMAIRKRFEKRKAVGLPVDEKTIDAVAKAFDEELQKTLNDCFNDFVVEREAVMFANRFGLSTGELADSFSAAQKKAYEGAIINPFDTRFTTRQKSDSYAQYYRQALRRIDALISEGVKEHRDRSLTNEFDEFLDEFLRYNYRKNAANRGGEIFTVSPELKVLLGIDGGTMMMADKTVKQKIARTDEFEDVVVSNYASPAESLMAKEAAEGAERRSAALAAKGAEAKPNEIITADQMKRVNGIKKTIVEAMAQFASGKNRTNAQKKVISLKDDLKKLIAEINPRIKDSKVEELTREAFTHFALLARGESFADPEGELKHVITGGRMSVEGVGFEEDLIGSVAAKIAWDKARHRGGDMFAMGDRMLEPLTAELVSMGIPKADAKSVAADIISSAKVVAKSIIDNVDASVTEAQVIAEAKTKAAKQALGNKIYKSFRRGYATGREGVDAHDRAERIVERQRMRAIRRAVGYTMADLNSELGINLISDLVNIGRDGFKYGTAKDLADDMVARTVVSFRMNNYEMRNATDGEIKADPVFRAELAATVSSWLVEAAKSLSYGQERELAIRDAMKLRVTMPPTLKELTDAIEHHAEMLGKNLGKMDVEATLKEIEKLIDARPKLNDDGTLDAAGAAGGTALSDTARVYARSIAPRLQEYWKFVKEAMWMDSDKVRDMMDSLMAKLDMDETDVAEVGGKNPSELKAERLAERDAAKMKLSALYRYGALKEKSAGEVLDIYRNDIATDIAFAAEQFMTERKRRMDENEAVANDYIDEIAKLLKDKHGYADIGKVHRALRDYYMWNVPDMFAKFGSYFKTDSRAHERIEQLMHNISLAHEEQMRLTSQRQGEMIQAVEQIYGMPFSKFVQENCVPDAKYSRFSRTGWAVPKSGGPTVEYWTGKYYQHDMPKLGKKKGDKIYETLHLAVPKTDPRHDDKTKFDTELSMANLIYIYAANRQKDMEKNAIIYGRDAAYMRDLENTIGTKGIMLADKIVGMFDAMRGDINPVCEYITGIPLMSPDKVYIPLRFLQDKSADRVTRYTVNPTPKFLMQRRFHDAATLKEDTNILELTSRMIQDAYHYKAFGVLADNTKEQLASKKVVTMFHKLLGDKTANSLFQQLNETFNGGVPIDNQGGVGIRNFITATCLGFSPSSSMKQLEGIGGWGLGMNPLQWAKMVLWDKWFNPDARDGIKILHETGFFEKHKTMLGFDTYQRAEGFSEPMLLLMNARESGGEMRAASVYTKAKEWYKSHMLDFMRFFDRVSTDFGAGTYYASRKNFYRMSKGMTEADAHKAALADTDYLIQIGQASGRPEFMHNMQRVGTAGKILTQFVGPTLVRAGVEIEAAHRHFMVDRSRQSFNNLVSKLFSAHVISPAILTTVTQLTNYLFRERDNKNAEVWDDFASRLMVSMLIGPMSGVLFVGQIADGALKKVANRNTNYYRPRGYEVPMASKLNAIADGLINVSKDAADITSCVLDGAEVTPQLIELIRQDTIRLLRPNIPMLQFIQLGVNAYDYIKQSQKKKR